MVPWCMDMCRRGLHPFDEQNTFWASSGKRYCRACAAARMRAHRSDPEFRQKEQARARGRKRKRDMRDWRRRTKQRVVGPLGGECECCGETDLTVLSIDHINGDGGQHRRELFGGGPATSGHRTYRWIIHEWEAGRWVEGLRVLCITCNLAASHQDDNTCRLVH